MNRTFYALDYDTLKVAFFTSAKERNAACDPFTLCAISARAAKRALRCEAANAQICYK